MCGAGRPPETSVASCPARREGARERGGAGQMPGAEEMRHGDQDAHARGRGRLAGRLAGHERAESVRASRSRPSVGAEKSRRRRS